MTRWVLLILTMDRRGKGVWGELVARRLLEAKGLQFEAANWRDGKCEIDLIFRDGPVLVFVEVKSRSSDFFGSPGSFLDIRQEQRITRAAARYCEIHDHQWEIRFDLVEILWRSYTEPEIKHHRDAFYPGDEGW